MKVQPDDFKVLAALCDRYVLTREQIHRICFDETVSQRTTRKRLLRLRTAGFASRHSLQVVLPGMNGAAPAYYPTRLGAEAAASFFDDGRFALATTKTPRGDRLAHWIALNDTRTIIEQAIALQEEVALRGFVNEWQVVNKDDAGEKQFVLHTQLCEDPPLSCSPDAALLLEVRGVRKVFYIEQDRATSSPKQIAARKSRGYAALATRQLHKAHFPDTTLETFSILFVTTNNYRCEATAQSMQRQERPDLWLYINQKLLSPQSFLHQPIVMNHEGQLGPLIKPVSNEVLV